MSQVGTTQTLRDRIEARRAALAQTAGAAPEPSLRDRIAARRAALGGTAQQEPAPVAQAAAPQQGLNAYFPRQQQAAPVRATGMPGMAPAGVDPQLLAQQDQIAREQFNYPGGDLMLGLARGVPVMERQAGGAMATVGNFLPGQLGRGLVRAGTDGGGLIAGQLNELPEPQTFGGQLMESVPGMAGSIGVGLATAGAGPALALGAGALSAGAQQGGGQFADAYDRTMATQAASPEQAANIAGTQGIMSGAVSALTSVVPMGAYLGKVAPNAVSKIAARFMGDRLASRLLVAAAAEGSQEATEQVGQMVAQYLAEDDPAAFENWKQQIALAAAGGAILGPAGEGFASFMAKGASPDGRNGDPTQGRNVAGRGPVGRAPSGVESPAAQQQQVRGVAPGVPGMVGTQGEQVGTQPGDVADERSVPLMADLAGDWERQAQADAEKNAAYTERLWDELAPQEQVAAEKADPSVMPGATGQVAPPLPGVEESGLDASAESLGSPEGFGTSAALAQVSAGQSLDGGQPLQAGDGSGSGLLQSGPLQNDSGPSGRQLSSDGLSNLRRKMLARRENLRAISQAKQMQAEQDATIGRQVAPVDRSAADAIAEGYDLPPDGGKMVEGYDLVGDGNKMVGDTTPSPNQSAIRPQTSREEAPKSDAPPAYRDWRTIRMAANSVRIIPNRVGGKFTSDQMFAIKEWAEGRGLSVHRMTENGMNVIGPAGVGKRVELDKYGIAGVKAEATAKAKNENAKADAAKTKEANTQADTRESAGWITQTFGDGFTNAYNRNALADYIEGKSKQFRALPSSKWENGLRAIGAIDADGTVKREKIKEAYEASKATPAPTPQAAEQEDPQYIRPSDLSGDMQMFAKHKDAAWKQVKALRQKVKDLGPRAGNVRLELLKAERKHHEFVQWEKDARDAAERRAQELGKTTKKAKPTPNSPAIPDSSTAKQPWEMTRAEFLDWTRTADFKSRRIVAEAAEKDAAQTVASMEQEIGKPNSAIDGRVGSVDGVSPQAFGLAMVADGQRQQAEFAQSLAKMPNEFRDQYAAAMRKYEVAHARVRSFEDLPTAKEAIADYPDLANRSETPKSSPKSEPALEGSGASDTRKGMAIIADRVRPHLQIFENTGDIKQQLRGMLIQWVNGGKAPPRTSGTKNGTPFSPQQTRQPLELAAKLANETGRVHSVVQIVDDSDKVLGQAVIEAPQMDGGNESLTNPQVFAWDRLLGGAAHIWPGYRVGERNTLERISRPKSELPPVASMDRAALLAELGVRKNHVAVYGGKSVAIEYASKDADEFRVAAQRVADNAGDGYVVTPSGEVFKISKGSRKAKPVTGDEQAEVLAKVGGSGPITGTVKKLREMVEAKRDQASPAARPESPGAADTATSGPAPAQAAKASGARSLRKAASAESAKASQGQSAPKSAGQSQGQTTGDAKADSSPKGTAPSMDTAKARATLAPKQQALSDKLGAERKTLEAMGNVPAEHKAQVVTVEEAAKRAPGSTAVVDARNVSSGAPETKGEIGDRTRKLRDFIREVPEFALDPHFIVAKVQDGRAVLRFQDGGRYSFAADAIGISFEVPPTVGQRVEIDLKAVKSMKHGESWIIAEPTGKAPSAAIKTEMAQRAGIAADDVGTEGTTSTAKKLIGWANQTEADARAKLRDKAKKQKGKLSSGIDPIEQAETAYQIGRWAAALVVRGGVKVAQAVYQIVGKVGPVQLRTRRAAEAITNQIIEAAGKNPTDEALTIAAGDVEAKHLDAQAATAERLAKAAETEIAAGTDPQGRAKVAADYRAQAAQLREQADAVRRSPKPEAKPKEAKKDTRPASVKISKQRAVLNVAAIVAFDAGKALKAGTKVGNKRLGVMVDAALARVPWMKGEREAIVRSARAILKDAGKDPAKIEAAHAAAAEELSQRAAAIKEAKKARGALVADMFKDSPDKRISGRQAMKERMRAVGKTITQMQTAGARTVIKAIRQTKQAGRAEAAAKIADLREKIRGERKRQADMRRIETRGAVDAAKDAARDQAAMQQGYKDQLVRLIRENMPRELRGKYLTAVRDVKTLARLGIEAGKMERDLLGYMARKQLKDAERLAGNARAKMGLERELRDELNKALGALGAVKRKLRGVATGAASVTTAAGTTANAKVSQLSAEDLREVIADIEDAAKTIASVRFMQDNMDKVRKQGEVVAGATIRQEMALALASAKDLPAGKDTKIREAGWLLRKLRRRLNWDSLTVMLDGGKGSGPFRQVFNAARKGREAALRLHHEFQDKIGTIVKANGYESTGRMLMETSGVLGEALQKTVTANVNGEPTTMTLGQAMYLYASSKDVGFLERIRKGQKVQFVTQRTSDPVSITEADLASVAMALTAKQRAMVDELKAAYDEHYFEKLSRTNKDLKGVFLDKVEGYWGIKLNRTMSEMRGVPTDWRGNYIAALEEAGFMQEREGPSQTPILIGDFGHDILTRSRSAAGTIAKAETTKMMMRTVLHPDTVAAITAKYGKQTIDQITRRIAEWSGGTKHSTTGQVWRELMQMWSRAKTQLRFPTWLRNAAGGSSRMLAELGAVDVASKAYRPSPEAYRELMQYSPIARERWAGGSAGNFYDTTGEDFADESLKDASTATLRNLAETAKGLLTLDAERAKVGGAGAWKSWKKTLDAITVGNYFDAHGAVVAYRVFMDKAPKDWPEVKRKKWAAGKAMRLFERTANTATVEYANDVQLDARENTWIGMMTAFTGDTAKAMNMVYQAQARARSGEITWGRAVRTIMSLLVGSALSAAIAAAWAAALGKGADKAKDAARNRFFQELGSLVPLGGGVATNAVQKLVMQIQSDSVLDVPMMDVLNSIKITIAELDKAMDAPTRKVRKNTVTAAERYVRALMQGARVADLAGIPSQYVFDAKAAIDNWGK